MPNKKYISLLILFCLAVSSMVTAQTVYEVDEAPTNNLSGRVGFELEKKFANRFTFQWDEELRLKNSFTDIDRIYSTVALDYECLPFMKVGVGYTFQAIWHDGKKKTNYQKYWDLRHRTNLDVAFFYKYNQWKFTLRERGLVTFRTDNPDLLEKANPNFQLRTKASAEYKFFNKPLKPYASFEVCNTLNAPSYAQGNYINAMRSEIGLKWRLDRNNSLNFYYRFDVNYDRDIDVDYKKDDVTIKAVYVTHQQEFNHIIGIVYAFDWR